ncbi:regulator of nucleoside diphosphate kinase [Phyllobacterium myrsinacearum]|uniref:Nucleoside diphosphate kinase regulator n=2 Tax=Phyllobacterium myrsinacearum TaxID=28101 RepID=A0A2S9JAY6_9HYPH|nr:nucleoside diphosphate kinase regulator [Phyllobacterium myrsinacearum]RZS76701.1 regulator of nucleoside diphosphate kinase [Phyllobacterium myrsinacearum]RZU96910.1 regulator of nucleoside diphosphate kinase [Phyllobacterium myrsinacearum]
MQHMRQTKRKPNIRISQTDHSRLTALASSSMTENPEVSEELLDELDRAKVVADGSIAAKVVQMGSTVTYKASTNDTKTVKLVFPGEADITQGKVSILTPIGTALIGLSIGQSISWTARNGRSHELTIHDVIHPLSVDQQPISEKSVRPSNE